MRRTIVLDLDGVIADLHEPWLARYNADFGDQLKAEDVRTWDMSEWVKPECGKEIYDYLWEETLWRNVPLIEGARAGVREMWALGLDVTFMTAGNPVAAKEKMLWLRKQELSLGPMHAWRDVVIAADKTNWPCWMMVDDRVETVRASQARYPVLFHQPWNHGATDLVRVHDWKGLMTLVRALIALESWVWARLCGPSQLDGVCVSRLAG